MKEKVHKILHRDFLGAHRYTTASGGIVRPAGGVLRTAVACLRQSKGEATLPLRRVGHLLKFVPNYPINLIAPAYIKDNDFDKFGTDLGLAMKVLKYQKAGAVEVIKETDHRKVDRNTAVFLNRVANLGLEFDEKEVSIDMCKAMEDYKIKSEVNGAIKGMRIAGMSDNDILTKTSHMGNWVCTLKNQYFS